MDVAAAIETLEYFEEKAAHLQSLAATRQVMKNFGAVVEWKKDQRWEGIFVGPEGEPIEAFVLTLRLFIINNEPISLRNMRVLYNKIPVGPDLVEQFTDQCRQLNEFLDRDTGLSIEEGRNLTYRAIFLLFLNGSLAHGNDPLMRRTYRELRGGEWFPLFQADFIQSLRGFVTAIHFLREINQEALQRLRANVVAYSVV